MYNTQHPYPFNEFYEGFQEIQNSYEQIENFGKMTEVHKNSKLGKGFKKITSAQSFSLNQGYNGSIKKSSSSNTFSGNEIDPHAGGKAIPSYKFNDESTKESHSRFSSITSLSSAGSMQTLSSHKGVYKQPGKKKPPTEMDFRNKYKTEVCRYWAEHGFCEFGDQCAFAHGENEVRQKSFVAQNFKTKQCVSFYETGYCVYGVRCQFLHCYRKDCHLNPRLMFSTYAEEIEMAEVWITENQDCLCITRQTRPRLPIFKKLAEGYEAPEKKEYQGYQYQYQGHQGLNSYSSQQNWSYYY